MTDSASTPEPLSQRDSKAPGNPEPATRAPGNWGRWGPDDERGAANFASAEHVLQAAGLVRRGAVYPLSVPVQSRGVPVFPRRAPCLHFMTLDGGDYAAGFSRRGGFQTSDDYLSLPTHGTTHVDALAHVWYDDTLYNGHPSTAVRSTGAGRCGIDKLRHLVGRGVLLDLCRHRGVDALAAGDVIALQELIGCAQAQDVDLRRGDIVLLRTGWQRTFREHGNEAFFAAEPGIGIAAAEWLGELGVAAIGCDNFGIEVIPTERGDPAPVHRRLIRDYGVYLFELLALDAIAADGVHEFMFAAAPLLITGGVGSPVNPLAIA